MKRESKVFKINKAIGRCYNATNILRCTSKHIQRNTYKMSMSGLHMNDAYTDVYDETLEVKHYTATHTHYTSEE
jgi:hypothetical protein